LRARRDARIERRARLLDEAPLQLPGAAFGDPRVEDIERLAEAEAIAKAARALVRSGVPTT